ncbi:phosphotransferase system HPr (HPr) family protein [Sedimentibacter acidaminivorans]|jgi:phosphotransferase system HPr (HPr) family protein|uniref:Phosphocarrier protein HPr n=1 Tax=Sedimentibacter acidaminivorans TaxID=913099 RepID=A0ABS4GDA3_9FIRM|nr:HPr family phosphocarrier protein [Sedimentibacter acidaminivorans]MBP1925666.1 phosphotransferase system HPr (HPr) family protein [Sedimentibacter acidaminivorans]
MRSQKVILKNKIGLHARPAAIFVKKARVFDSEIIIKKGIQEANGKSIISIMALGAMKGDELIILTKGSDEDKCITELSTLLESMDEEE